MYYNLLALAVVLVLVLRVILR